MAITSTVADLLLEWTLVGNSSLPNAAVFLGWCTGDPGDSTSTTNNELSTGTYVGRRNVLGSYVEELLPGAGGGAKVMSTASVSWSPTAADTLTYFVVGSSVAGAGHNFHQAFSPSYTTASGVNFYMRGERLRISLTGNLFTTVTANGVLRELFSYVASPSSWRVFPNTTRYFGLSETVPNADGSNITELSGSGYTRVAASDNTMYSAANPEPASNFGLLGRALANSGTVTFPTATAQWNAVSGWFISDLSTGGTPYACGPLDSTVTVLNGEAPLFRTDEFVCALY